MRHKGINSYARGGRTVRTRPVVRRRSIGEARTDPDSCVRRHRCPLRGKQGVCSTRGAPNTVVVVVEIDGVILRRPSRGRIADQSSDVTRRRIAASRRRRPGGRVGLGENRDVRSSRVSDGLDNGDGGNVDRFLRRDNRVGKRRPMRIVSRRAAVEVIAVRPAMAGDATVGERLDDLDRRSGSDGRTLHTRSVVALSGVRRVTTILQRLCRKSCGSSTMSLCV